LLPGSTGGWLGQIALELMSNRDTHDGAQTFFSSIFFAQQQDIFKAFKFSLGAIFLFSLKDIKEKRRYV
jgi:hypothetical protein